LTEYTDIYNSCLLSLKITGNASQHNAEKRMLWHHHLTHVRFNAAEILQKFVADASEIVGKFQWESSIMCKVARKPFTPNTNSSTTEPLQLVHTDLSDPLETAIGGCQYMLLFIDDVRRHTDEYSLKYKWDAMGTFKQWKALREKESGHQVKRFHTNGASEYTSKKFL